MLRLSDYSLKSYKLALLLSAIALSGTTLSAKKRKKHKGKKHCVVCPDVKCSKAKVEKGFIRIPDRPAPGTGDIIPEANLFFRMQANIKRDKKSSEKQRPTLVFIHDIGESEEIWRCQQAELSKCFNTIAFDLRGSGRSTKSDPSVVEYNLALFADDIAVAFSELGIENPVWVGHGLGGAIGVMYINRRRANPERTPLDKLVFVGTDAISRVPETYTQDGCDDCCPDAVNPDGEFCWAWPVFTNPELNAFKVLAADVGFEQAVKNELIPRYYNEDCKKELVCVKKQLLETYLVQGEAIFNNIFANAGGQDIRPLLSLIDIPTLVTFGTIDAWVPPAVANFFTEEPPTPSRIANSAAFGFEAKGHVPFVTDFSNFNKALKAFVEGKEIRIKQSEKCCVCPLVTPDKKRKKHKKEKSVDDEIRELLEEN